MYQQEEHMGHLVFKNNYTKKNCVCIYSLTEIWFIEHVLYVNMITLTILEI